MDTAALSSVPARLANALAGRYRVERVLGAGGMATVYLAQDLKHARPVAIKVLKPELAAVLGADRFLTEITTTANLQHPHILPLFDSGEADTYLYYVMPFIEGESLRDRLHRERQLGVEEAVRIARDVADALDYAHRHGVIHRDIKPENILLHDGRPLVADFGIALAISAAGGGRLTETGLSLGTPHYMSPEQASAERDLSARSDVYSLGCVLYEMLAGEPPHTGPTAASILMRILTEQPRPLLELRPTVPAHVAAAVAKAVEKLPADRFDTAKDFRVALEDPAFRFSRATRASTAATVAMAAPVISARGWDRRSKGLAALALALAATAGWLALRPRAIAAPDAGILAFQLADSVPNAYFPFTGPGGWIAVVEGRRLLVRAPGSVHVTPLAGAGDLADDIVSFSPDGEWIAYVQPAGGGNTLRKIPTRGGTAVPVATIASPTISPFWSTDGLLYVVIGGPGRWAVVRIPESGGAVDTVFRAGVNIPYGFDMDADGRVLLFGLFNASVGDPRIIALDLRSGDTSTVVPGGYQPQVGHPGHLLFARNEGSLFAAPFDAGRMRLAGSPAPVLDSLAENFPLARYSLAASGALVYVSGRKTGTTSGASYTLQFDAVDGGKEDLPLRPSDHWDAKIAPDGRRLAYIRNDHVWVYDLDLGTHTQLTREGTRHHNPTWSPDGKQLAFSSAAGGRTDVDVYVVDAQGATPTVRFGGGPADEYPTQWLADGSVLVHTQGALGENIVLVRAGDSTQATPILHADWAERIPRVSPDGRWLAYASAESGRPRLYVRRWPSLEGRVQVSDGDAPLVFSSFALWSSDGRTLYYHQDNRLIAATVDGTGEVLRVLSRRVIAENVRGILADLHPDGRRLLVMALETAAADTVALRAPKRSVVVTNWASTLRSRPAPR